MKHLHIYSPGGRALFALAGILFVSGCGRTGTDSGTEGGPVQLTYWSSQNPQERELAVRLVDAWNALNPDVQVTVQPLPAGQSSEEVLLAAIVAGTTPDVCSNIWPGIVSDFVRAGGILALDEYPGFDSLMQSRVPEYLLDRFRSDDGRMYQLPWKSNPVMMQYNVRFFREAGFEEPPRTFSEFLDAAEKISRDLNGDGQFDRWIGYRTIQPIWFERFFDYYAFYIAASGGKTLYENKELRIDTTASNRVLEFFARLYAGGFFPKTKFQANAFVTRQIATEFVGPWNIAWLEANAPADLEYGYAPLPVPDDYQGISYTYGDFKNIAIFSGTEHPEEAWEFAKFLVSESADLQLLKLATQIPIRKDLLVSPVFSSYFSDHPKIAPFAEQVVNTRGVEGVRSFPEILDSIAQQFEAAAVYGVRSPEEATRLAIQRIKVIEEWNRE